MLKLNKNECIPEESIEAVFSYAKFSHPISHFIKTANTAGLVDDARLGRKMKSIIVNTDGKLFLCSLSEETYMKRLDQGNHSVSMINVDQKKIYFQRCEIVKCVSHLSAGHRREIRKAKEENRFISLTSGKKTTYYIFMKSGYVYGIHSNKDISTL